MIDGAFCRVRWHHPRFRREAVVHPTEFKLSFRPPSGWMVPQVPGPPDSVRLTPGGVHPGEAPASLMVRGVDKDDDSFEQYCAREFGAMIEAFAGGSITELLDLPVSGTWKALQVGNNQRMAIVTLIEQEHFFVWFGIVVTERSQMEAMTALYREALRSFVQSVVV